MIVIKLILIIFLVLVFFILTFTNKYKTLNKIIILCIFMVIFLFILFPSKSDIISNWFGISTGANLALYLGIAILFLSVSMLYAKQKKQDKIITKIIRKKALDNFIKND